nr:hypothetical protein [Tanacetum cinerariifolium]
MTEAQKLKLVTKRILRQTHISQASVSSADEGTGSILGVPDVPTDESEEELSWNSNDEEGDDDEGKDGDGDGDDDGEEGDGDDDDEDDDGEEGNDDDDQEDEEDDGGDDGEDDKCCDDEQESDEEEFIHLSLSTHTKEEARDEESIDHIPKTPENSDDEGNGEEDLGLNVGRAEGHDEEEEEDELYRDVNINQGRGIQTTQEVKDSHVTLTPVNPDGMELIFETTLQMDAQTPISVAPLPMSVPTLTSSTIATIPTTQQAPTLPTTAPRTLLQDLPNFGSLFGYMDKRMNEAVQVAVQLQSDRLREEAQKENDEFLKTIDENMQKIIKEQVKEQVKRNLYKALVEAYESDKIILDTYGDTVMLKRRRDDDADKDEEPFAGPDRGSKRRREGKEPESASAPTETATRSAGKSTQGTKSRQTSASESATAEEPMQTSFEMEEPSHPEFETGADDQLIVESSQHPEWFSQQHKPPTPDRDDDEGKDGDGDGDDDGEEGDGDDDDEDDDGEEGNDDDDQEDEGDDEGDDGEDDKCGDDEQESDEEEFIHLSLSTHTKEEARDEESFDHIPKTPKNSDDEGNGEEDLALNVGREEGHDEEEEEDELYRDVNINQGRGIQMNQEVEDSHVTLTLINPDGMELIFETTSQMDAQTPISVAPLHMSVPTLTSSTIATIPTTQQAQTLPTTAPRTLLQDLPNFGSLFGFANRLKTLEANFSKFMQTNKFARAVSAIPEIIHRYMDKRMNEAVQVAVQLQSDRLREEAQKENDEFLKTIDENMQKIIKEQVKEQVKVQVSKILPRIEQTVNEQLEAKVLTRSSNLSKTSYAVAADLSEMELKKILIEKMEGNKRRDDDADKDEEPFAGPDRGSKRRREGKEPESASAPTETATRSAGKSTQGTKSRQTSASKSATAEEPMQTSFEMEEPSHPEFETGADDQLIVESSKHPEWFSQQHKPPTPDRDWNKTLPVTHGSIQPWISELTKQSDSRSSFNELMDTPVDFSNFLINRLKVDTLIPEILAGPTYELLKGSCKSLLELEYHLEEGCKRQHFYDFAINRESARDVYSKRRITFITELKIIEWHNYKHLDWITMRRDDDKLYKFKEGDFKRLHIQDIEDMLLLLVQGKLTNLTVEERFAFNVSLQIFTRSIVIQRRVEDLQLDKQNRLMRIDELHKFNDGTLTDVRTTLDDHLKGIRMKYLPQTIWRKSDKERAAAMIQAIDKKLKTRRIMRSLERFVGGRLYEGDFRMLQRTI